MSRLKKVIKDASEYQSANDLRPSDARLTNFYLRQISETLAMIFDEKNPKRCGLFDETGFQKCFYANEQGNCEAMTYCRYRCENE